MTNDTSAAVDELRTQVEMFDSAELAAHHARAILAHIATLEARAERAEAAWTSWRGTAAQLGHDLETVGKRAEALTAEVALLREALEPFAAVAECDIGDDERDDDTFRPMSRHNRAVMLTVGDLRRAAEVLAAPAQDRPDRIAELTKALEKIETARQVIAAYEQGKAFRFPSGIRAIGVGHVGDNPRALVVTLTDPPGDDDIRALHDWLVWRPSALDAEWCINMARQEGDSEIGAGVLARDPVRRRARPEDGRRGC